MLIRLWLLLFWVSACFGGVDPALEKGLVAAGELVNIRGSDGKPFQMEVGFHAQVSVPLEGHLTLKWKNENQWQQEIRLGDFQETQVKNGDSVFTKRNGPFTPLRVVETVGLLGVFSFDPQGWKIKKAKHRETLDSDCLEMRPHAHEQWSPEERICLQHSTGDVVEVGYKDDQESRRKEFSEYVAFGSHRYPKHLKLLVNSSVALDARVDSLSESSFEDAVFMPPPGAIARRQCKHMVHPIPIKQPDPAYPRSAAQNGMGGTATVTLTVLPDGSVTDVQLIGSAGREMDQVTQEIIRTWKFKPAMCGDEPVAADISVQMNFRLE